MIDPIDMAKQGSEHAIQVAVFMYFANPEVAANLPETRWLHAIPNGGDRNPKAAAAMKAEGVKSGVSDLSLPCARRGYHGLYIEVKKPGNKASQTQKDFAQFVAQEGYLCVIIDKPTPEECFLEVVNIIQWYLSK